MPNPRYDWNYSTTVQIGLNRRAVSFARGKILGGSSSISKADSTKRLSYLHFYADGMFYTRSSSDDFDRFARVTKEPGWSWKRLQPYILRVRYKTQKF